jgi:chromosome segregation ATPase
VNDRSQSVQIEAFEQVLAAPGIALLRLLAARSRRRNPASRPNLVITDDQSTHRFAPLPAPDDPRGVLRAAYSVPVDLLDHEVTFALEFQNGALALPQPTAGSMRPTTRAGKQDPGQSGTAEAEQDDDRRTNIHEKLVQQSEALADSERAATTRDRSQRRALGKLRTELEQHEEEEQRAWTRMRDLEQQLERQATDIVARIDASDAELAQAREALSAADQRAGSAAEQAASAQVRAETAERRIPELEAAANEHAQRNAELEQRHRQMEQELASAESERARIGERLEHVSDALRVMTFERDELTRQVSAHDSVAVKARERAHEAEKAQAAASAALVELEAWSEELGRRLTELTSELAATKQAFEEAESERRRLDGALAESDARTELAEGRSASLSAQLAELTAQLSEREAELADAARAADESTAELQARVSSLEEAAAQAENERAEQDRRQAADAAELEALRVAQPQAQATLATLRSELEEARLHADRSGDLEREVEASRGDADRLQAAVVRLESEIRSTGHGQPDSLRNGSDRELAAVSSALEGARQEMNALRQELEAAQASERRANLELVMLTAETQARLQAQTELKQAARESGLIQ